MTLFYPVHAKKLTKPRNRPKIQLLSLPRGRDGGEDDLALGLPVGRHGGGGSQGLPPHTAKLYSSEDVKSFLNTHKCVTLLCAGISQEYRSGRRTKEKREKMSRLLSCQKVLKDLFLSGIPLD